jgi:hypothetical protein
MNLYPHHLLGDASVCGGVVMKTEQMFADVEIRYGERLSGSGLLWIQEPAEASFPGSVPRKWGASYP